VSATIKPAASSAAIYPGLPSDAGCQTKSIAKGPAHHGKAPGTALFKPWEHFDLILSWWLVPPKGVSFNVRDIFCPSFLATHRHALTAIDIYANLVDQGKLIQ
jgi:hypothetical protein